VCMYVCTGVVVAVHVVAATDEFGLGVRRWMVVRKRSGARGGRVDGRPETE
jgi:hypothetical protein